jgi:cytochrome c biogenesis protein CcmG, thiol:disulfide interchange protein DsbE
VRRWLLALPLVVLVALAALFAGYALKHDPRVDPAALVGKRAPPVSLATLDGGPAMPLTARVKGPFLVNFFASWCAPCRIEHPALMALKAQGVPIVGVAYKDKPEAARGFIEELGNPFTTIVLDLNGRAGVEYGASGVPETFVVGGDGRILAKHTGPLTPEAAEALAERLDAR